MTKEKLVEASGLNSNSLMKYSPLLLSMVSLLACYLLNKKLNTVNSHNDSIMKIEQQFTKFIKEQTDVNNNIFNKMNT